MKPYTCIGVGVYEVELKSPFFYEASRFFFANNNKISQYVALNKSMSEILFLKRMKSGGFYLQPVPLEFRLK